MITSKNATTEVKYTLNGEEKVENVAYTTKVAADLEGAMELANDSVPAVGETVKDGDKEIAVTAENRQDLMVAFILNRFNQVEEANARQAARARFLNTVAGPDKAIQSMAKKLASAKNITVEEAEKQIRKQFFS